MIVFISLIQKESYFGQGKL